MLIAHIVFRFDYGGLENGVVNIINRTSNASFRHVVIALTEATEFADRLRDGVDVYSIRKRPGKDLRAYFRLFGLLRRLRPDVVHTRNIGTMDCALVAFCARVPIRIHGEHGWDVFDPDGTNARYRRMRQFLHHFVYRIVTVSEDLRSWLVDVVGIPQAKVQHICNGVDTDRFRPSAENEQKSQGDVVIGSVTRFSAIKDPLNLVESFIELDRSGVLEGKSVRLVMIGDGELHGDAVHMLQHANLGNVSWLPGSRDDVPELLRQMDVFVLGSLREGISNTVLEAMASGLPVVASNTGGNVELIDESNGTLVPPGDRVALARAIEAYLRNPELITLHGTASRVRVMSRFSIMNMVDDYRRLYEHALGIQVN